MPSDDIPAPARRRRLPPQERREEILEKAVEFFAEQGFDSSTRELARQIGITQPLLFRYFPSKDDLIHEVYRKIYLDRWDEEWDRLLRDRTRPLDERLCAFYQSYTSAVFSREWMRIYLFSGLRGAELNRRYVDILEDRILARIVREYRWQAGLDDAVKPAPEEMELAWALHSGIFYIGIREHIFDLTPRGDRSTFIANTVRAFDLGFRAYFSDVGSQADGGLSSSTSHSDRLSS